MLHPPYFFFMHYYFPDKSAWNKAHKKEIKQIAIVITVILFIGILLLGLCS